MDRSPAALKFMVAFSIPGLFLLLAVIGGDNWSGYGAMAFLLTIVGAVCIAQAVSRNNRYLAGVSYVAFVGLLPIVLP